MVIEDKSFEVFIEKEKIKKRVEELALQISVDYRDKEILFIPILNGAFLFASDLIRDITVPCHVSFVKVSSYEGTESSGTIKSVIGLNTDIKGKNIILIDDIVDTGLTMKGIVEEFSKQAPASIGIATLLLKPEALKKQLELNYVGFTIPNSFVVGYGLDYDGYGRNLKDIYRLESES